MSLEKWSSRLRRTIDVSRAIASFDSSDRNLALEALVTLVTSAFVLRLGPGRRLSNAMQFGVRRSRRASDSEARSVANVVAAVSSALAPNGSCLQRSVAIDRMLERRGIASQVVVGIRYVDGGIHGHSWIETDGLPLLDPPDISRHYAPVSPALTNRYTTSNGVVFERS